MLRARLTVLVTLAALLAPWAAPCMTTAPAGHAQMACCRTAAAGVPVARPCCALGDQPPLAPAPTAASIWAGAPSASFAPIPVAAVVAAVHLPPVAFASLPLQLRSTVLLI